MIKCVHCDQVKFKGITEKFRVCEKPRAEQFLRAVRFYNDDRGRRLADIDDADALIAADIYSHKECMNLYLMKYEYDTSNCTFCQESCRKNHTSVDYDQALNVLTKARQRRDQEIERIFSSSVDEHAQVMLMPCKAHLRCLNNYLTDGPPTRHQDCFRDTVIPIIDDMIREKFGLTITQIKEYLSEKWPGVTFYSHHIK